MNARLRAEALEVIVAMLMRFDPFREIDRVCFSARPSRRAARRACRWTKTATVTASSSTSDLPGVDPTSIDVSTEQNVLTISAERHWEAVEGDEVVANERRQGTFTPAAVPRQRASNADDIHATYDNGVLTLTIPVAEKAKARQDRGVQLEHTASDQRHERMIPRGDGAAHEGRPVRAPGRVCDECTAGVDTMFQEDPVRAGGLHGC